MLVNKVIANVSSRISEKLNVVKNNEQKAEPQKDNYTAKIYDYENKENSKTPYFSIPNMVRTGFGSFEPQKKENKETQKTSQPVMASNGFLNYSYKEIKEIVNNK